jgi:hypothetical protein
MTADLLIRSARAYGVGDAVTFMDPSLESGEIRPMNTR